MLSLLSRWIMTNLITCCHCLATELKYPTHTLGLASLKFLCFDQIASSSSSLLLFNTVYPTASWHTIPVACRVSEQWKTKFYDLKISFCVNASFGSPGTIVFQGIEEKSNFVFLCSFSPSFGLNLLCNDHERSSCNILAWFCQLIF